MTRPRISGRAASCRLVLDSEMKVMLAAPTSGSTTSMAPKVGMTLATSTIGAEDDAGDAELATGRAGPVGGDQAADDGADAHGRGERAVAAGPGAEGVLGDRAAG